MDHATESGQRPAAGRTLSLAAGVLPECSPAQVADAAARAGFDHVGFTLTPVHCDENYLRDLRGQVDRLALSVLDVEVAWIPAGGKLDDGHRRLVEAGGRLGAANLLAVSDEADPARAADALRQLCEWAAPYRMRVALEFLMITAVQTLHQALTIVRRCEHPAAALLIDSLHLQRAGHTPADVSALPAALLPYAQLCDGPRDCETSHAGYLRDALDLRSAPGEGALPLRALLELLPAGCPLSLEVRSAHYRTRYPAAADRARAVRSRTLDFLRPAPRS